LTVVEIQPDERAALAHQGQERIGQGLERIRGDVHRDRDVVPLCSEEVVAETRLGGEPDRMEDAVDVSPLLGECLANGDAVLGHRDVEFEHVDVVAELAGGSLRQTQRPARAREHDVGTLASCESGYTEGQRGVGEDAGDHDLLAVEQTHVRDRR
jgi:hypothetical protein